MVVAGSGVVLELEIYAVVFGVVKARPLAGEERGLEVEAGLPFFAYRRSHYLLLLWRAQHPQLFVVGRRTAPLDCSFVLGELGALRLGLPELALQLLNFLLNLALLQVVLGGHAEHFKSVDCNIYGNRGSSHQNSREH